MTDECSGGEYQANRSIEATRATIAYISRIYREHRAIKEAAVCVGVQVSLTQCVGRGANADVGEKPWLRRRRRPRIDGWFKRSSRRFKRQ